MPWSHPLASLHITSDPRSSQTRVNGHEVGYWNTPFFACCRGGLTQLINLFSKHSSRYFLSLSLSLSDSVSFRLHASFSLSLLSLLSFLSISPFPSSLSIPLSSCLFMSVSRSIPRVSVPLSLSPPLSEILILSSLFSFSLSLSLWLAAAFLLLLLRLLLLRSSVSPSSSSSSSSSSSQSIVAYSLFLRVEAQLGFFLVEKPIHNLWVL